MLSQLVHQTSTILRKSRVIVPWSPSSLAVSHFSTSLRAHSRSRHSQPANWSHLNDVYSRAVDVKPNEPLITPEERWAMFSRNRMANSTPLKGPYAGRSFEVKHGNVADALNKLQYTLRRNRVIPELRLAARHEKKGYKRRRLCSERWRKRFAHEVRKKVQLVNKIRARGE